MLSLLAICPVGLTELFSSAVTLWQIKRAGGTNAPRLLHDMQIDHGGGHIGVNHQLLHGSDERVTGCFFVNCGFSQRIFELVSQGFLVQMMARYFTEPGMGTESGGETVRVSVHYCMLLKFRKTASGKCSNEQIYCGTGVAFPVELVYQTGDTQTIPAVAKAKVLY